MRSSKEINKEILEYDELGQQQLTNELLLDIRNILIKNNNNNDILVGGTYGNKAHNKK
jgi:hypothetical protein